MLKYIKIFFIYGIVFICQFLTLDNTCSRAQTHSLNDALHKLRSTDVKLRQDAVDFILERRGQIVAKAMSVAENYSDNNRLNVNSANLKAEYKHREVAMTSYQVLGEIKAYDSIPFLVKNLNSKGPYPYDRLAVSSPPPWNEHHPAAYALIDFGTASVEPLLDRVFEGVSNDEVRLAATVLASVHGKHAAQVVVTSRAGELNGPKSRNTTEIRDLLLNYIKLSLIIQATQFITNEHEVISNYDILQLDDEDSKIRLRLLNSIARERRELISGLQFIVRDWAAARGVGPHAAMSAIVLLGELHATEAIPLLTRHLAFKNPDSENLPQKEFRALDYPSVNSLVRIGSVSLPLILKNDDIDSDPFVARLTGAIYKEILGKEIAIELLQSLKNPDDSSLNTNIDKIFGRVLNP